MRYNYHPLLLLPIGPLAGKEEADSCAPGQECDNACARTACNVGEVYRVECPANCLKQQLGGGRPISLVTSVCVCVCVRACVE